MPNNCNRNICPSELNILLVPTFYKVLAMHKFVPLLEHVQKNQNYLNNKF